MTYLRSFASRSHVGVLPRRRVRSPGRAAASDVSILSGAEAYWKASQYSGTGALLDLSGNAHHAQLGSTAGADSNDPLPLGGLTTFGTVESKYIYLPGSAGNYLSTPDSAALSITGDIDIRVAVAMSDWTPSGSQVLVAKFAESVGDGYEFYVRSDGLLAFSWEDAVGTISTKLSTVVPTIADGALLLIRATLDVNNGAVGHDVKFFTKTSTEATARADALSNSGWTQLGATVTTAVTTSIKDGTPALNIGREDAGTSFFLSGKIYAAVIKSGIDGTTVFDLDPSVAVEPYATFAEQSSNLATVTINRSATGRTTEVVDRPLFLAGPDDDFRLVASDVNFGTGPFTVAVCYRSYDSGAATPVHAGNGNGGTTGWDMLRVAGNEIRFTIRPAPAAAAIGPAAWTPGILAVHGGVRSATALTGYIDGTAGTPVGANNGDVTTAGPTRLMNYPGAQPTTGSFVAAAMFTRALSAAEMVQLAVELKAA